MSKYLCALAAVAVSLVSLSATARAAEVNVDGFVTKTVRIDDLNLATVADQKRLDQRVYFAAKAMCRVGERNIEALKWQNECFGTAMRSAKTEVAALIEKAVRAKG